MDYLIGVARGNYIYSETDKKCGEVTDIFTSKSGVDMIGLLIREEKVFRGADTIKPIEINEDWLWYLGFCSLYNDNNYSLGYSDKHSWLEVNHSHDFTYAKFGTNYGLRHENKLKIEYVHQLQNLYYLATMQELKIKNFTKRPVKDITEKPIDWENEWYVMAK